MIKPALVLPISLLLSGCGALPAASSSLPFSLPPLGSPVSSQLLTGTVVTLKKQNYRLVKADAKGESKGFSFLGLFSFRQPEYMEAITQLYHAAGISEGKALALVNIAYQQSSTYFILFALPKITVRADVVEFVDGGTVKGLAPQPPNVPAESP